MSTASSNNHAELRCRAEVLIHKSKAPGNQNAPSGAEDLTWLHRLAGDPQKTVDAMKLLHELQVHQVELSLQHEQLILSERGLGEELAAYTRLFDFAPVGYFSVDPNGTIIDVNLEGARLCGGQRTDLFGRHIGSFLMSESLPMLADLLQRVHRVGPHASCEVRLASPAGSRPQQVQASVGPGSTSVMLVFMEVPRPPSA